MSTPFLPLTDSAEGTQMMCTVSDVIESEYCLRVARWIWHPTTDDHPVFLCNFHSEPFWPVDTASCEKRLS